MNFLVVNWETEHEQLMNYEQLKQFLIDNIKNDINTSKADYVVSIRNKQLEELEGTGLEWKEKLLLTFGYKVVDLFELKKDLLYCSRFFTKDKDSDVFCEAIDKINEGVK